MRLLHEVCACYLACFCADLHAFDCVSVSNSVAEGLQRIPREPLDANPKDIEQVGCWDACRLWRERLWNSVGWL